MRVLERTHERQPDLEDLLVGKPILGDQQSQGVALDQLGDQVESVVVGARLVQSHDRRVSQARGGERLACGSLAVLLGRQRDALDRDRAVEQLVVGAPHGAEPARAEALDQAVATEQQLVSMLRALVGDAYAALDEGLWRSPPTPRSPPPKPFPCQAIARSALTENLQSHNPTGGGVILVSFTSPCKEHSFVVLRRRGRGAADNSPAGAYPTTAATAAASSATRGRWRVGPHRSTTTR